MNKQSDRVELIYETGNSRTPPYDRLEHRVGPKLRIGRDGFPVDPTRLRLHARNGEILEVYLESHSLQEHRNQYGKTGFTANFFLGGKLYSLCAYRKKIWYEPA